MLAFVVLFLCLQTSNANALVDKIRYPVAVGSYYPENPKELTLLVKKLIDDANRPLRFENTPIPKALIVPHSPLYFAGSVMASGYALLAKAKPFIKRVVIISSVPQNQFFGIALTRSAYFEMPTKRFQIDTDTISKLSKIPGITFEESPYLSDHSIEVQLPFIESIFNKNVQILPILVGDASVEQISDLIDSVWGDLDTVVIISSDLSQYQPYAKAKKNDLATAQLILNKKFDALKASQADAFLPIAGLLHYAKENNISLKMIDLRNSGDTFSESDKVIGFGAFAAYENSNDTDQDKKNLESLLQTNQLSLLRLAGQSILSGFHRGRALQPNISAYPVELQQNGAVFVSIYHNGVLRGSVGSAEPHQPLVKDIAQNAYAAAFEDFRFEPLSEQEIKEAEISISFLTPKTPIKFKDQDDLIRQVRSNVDGLVLRERSNKGLFLPSVWETFSSVPEFLSHLKRKAGLPADYWSDTLKIYRFEVIDINSGDLEIPSSIWEKK